MDDFVRMRTATLTNPFGAQLACLKSSHDQDLAGKKPRIPGPMWCPDCQAHCAVQVIDADPQKCRLQCPSCHNFDGVYPRNSTALYGNYACLEQPLPKKTDLKDSVGLAFTTRSPAGYDRIPTNRPAAKGRENPVSESSMKPDPMLSILSSLDGGNTCTAAQLACLTGKYRRGLNEGEVHGYFLRFMKLKRQALLMFPNIPTWLLGDRFYQGDCLLRVGENQVPALLGWRWLHAYLKLRSLGRPTDRNADLPVSRFS